MTTNNLTNNLPEQTSANYERISLTVTSELFVGTEEELSLGDENKSAKSEPTSFGALETVIFRRSVGQLNYDHLTNPPTHTRTHSRAVRENTLGHAARLPSNSDSFIF